MAHKGKGSAHGSHRLHKLMSIEQVYYLSNIVSGTELCIIC